MNALLAAILSDARTQVRDLLKAEPTLATQRTTQPKLYTTTILHWLYAGDTALHLAAAGHRADIVRLLLAAGADVNVAGKLRNATPLHYAADGNPGGLVWDADRQVKTIDVLLKAGAAINAQDKNGATPLHRAVRTRCAAAVKRLLDAGADPTLKNKPGSTPFHLAVQDTGRGGSGSPEAREGQREIIRGFLERGVSRQMKDGKGNSVIDCARSESIRELLTEDV